MWQETERFRVATDGGLAQIMVKMTNHSSHDLLLKAGELPPEWSYYFILDKPESEIDPLPDGTFRDRNTDRIFRRIQSNY